LRKVRSSSSSSSSYKASLNSSSASLLRKVIESNKPLSSWDIEQTFEPKGTYTHTYYMLERLVPEQTRLEPLFVWQKVSPPSSSSSSISTISNIDAHDDDDNSNYYNKNFINRINDVFKLYLKLDKQEGDYRSNEKYVDNMSVQKSLDNSTLTVTHGIEEVLFKVELLEPKQKSKRQEDAKGGLQQQHHVKSRNKNINNEDATSIIKPLPAIAQDKNPHHITTATPTPMLTVFSRQQNEVKPIKYRLAAKRNEGGELMIYVKQFTSLDHIRYLDVVLKRKPRDREEEMEMWNNRRNWLYEPNLRGLLKVILHEIGIQEVGRKEAKKHRRHNVRISHMLDNLSEHFAGKFQFLLYYRDFMRAFQRREKEKKQKG
jgi:hypothetical protein